MKTEISRFARTFAVPLLLATGGNALDEATSPHSVMAQEKPDSHSRFWRESPGWKVANETNSLPIIESLTGDPKKDIRTVMDLSYAAFPENQALAELCASAAFLETNIDKKPSELAMTFKNLFALHSEGTDGKEKYISNTYGKNATITDSFEQFVDVMNEPRYKDNGIFEIASVEEGARILSENDFRPEDPSYAEKLLIRWNSSVVPNRSDTIEQPDGIPSNETQVDEAPFETAAQEVPEELPGDVAINTEMQQYLAETARAEAYSLNSVGACLAGVQNALIQVGLQTELDRVPAAKDMIWVLRNDPDFTEVPVPREQIPYLGAGYVVVYEGDPTSFADDVYGLDGNFYPDNGHIEVSLGNGEFASDHINFGGGLALNSQTYVFAPR